MGALQTVCSVLENQMPMGCKCTDNGKLSSSIACGMKLLDLDQFYITLNLSPCAQAAALSVVVSETKLGFKFPITGLSAGQSKQVLIPGLAVGIPGIGGVGVTLDIKFGGSCGALFYRGFSSHSIVRGPSLISFGRRCVNTHSTGNFGAFYLKLGVNACGKALGQTVCGSSLTDTLPINLFDYTYQFSNVCASAK